MTNEQWEWNDLLRLVLLRCVPNCRCRPITTTSAGEKFQKATGMKMKDVGEKLAILEDVNLVVRGGTAAKLTWGRTKPADELVTLIRGGLDGAKIPPNHWMRLKDIQGRPQECSSARRGRICRTVERVVLLSLLERGALSEESCGNGIGWICGVPCFDIKLIHYLGKEMFEWELLRRREDMFELTEFGREKLTFARKAFGLEITSLSKTWGRWPSAFDRLNLAPPVFLGRKNPRQRAVEVSADDGNKSTEVKDPLRESFRFLLGQDGLALVAILALIETPTLSDVVNQERREYFLQLQNMGLVQQAEDSWLLTSRGEQTLLLFRALLEKKNKAYIVGSLLSDPGPLRGAAIRTALLIAVRKLSSKMVLDEKWLRQIVHRMFDGVATVEEIREAYSPLRHREWVRLESPGGLVLKSVGEVRLQHLSRVLERGEEESFPLRELLPEDLLRTEESQFLEPVAPDDSDDEWLALLRQADQRPAIGFLFAEPKERDQEKDEVLRRFLEL